ncbi:MAG: phenylacetate-CoA oxygenase subunit PaaJ [Chitinophagales bacterium]|nr:phenylacetate-CoA oxygenase subunit PaaJ [Chitinophagales bacterium]
MNDLIEKAADIKEVWNALASVMDPEIPVLSVVDLGIISKIEIENHSITIKITPTFVACPAIKMMQQQIKETAHQVGFESVNVIVDNTVSWNSDRITEEGKEKLVQFGLGTPLLHKGEFSLDEINKSVCPFCGSNDTTMNSLFGSTLCRSMHFCFECKQSFERFKPL